MIWTYLSNHFSPPLSNISNDLDQRRGTSKWTLIRQSRVTGPNSLQRLDGWNSAIELGECDHLRGVQSVGFSNVLISFSRVVFIDDPTTFDFHSFHHCVVTLKCEIKSDSREVTNECTLLRRFHIQMGYYDTGKSWRKKDEWCASDEVTAWGGWCNRRSWIEGRRDLIVGLPPQGLLEIPSKPRGSNWGAAIGGGVKNGHEEAYPQRGWEPTSFQDWLAIPTGKHRQECLCHHLRGSPPLSVTKKLTGSL